MNYIIKITKEAEKDIINIRDYILEKSYDQDITDKFINRIKRRIAALNIFPERGKEYEHIPELKYLIEQPYLVFYRIFETSVEIIRIIHGKRDYAKLFNS